MNSYIKKLIPFLSVLALLVSCSDRTDELLARKISELSDMSELGTVEYTVKKIISADDAVWYKYGDRKILYSCVVYLKAGIDMSAFTPEDVVVDKASESITVTLPKPVLLSFNMPNDRIDLLYEHVSGLRFEFTQEERLYLKQQAETAIRKDVPNMGILKDAEKNAAGMFAAMFSGLGYENIDVNFK